MARKTKLTPERQEKIVKALRAGNYFDAACQYGGIAETTGYEWLKKAETRNGIYAEFRKAVLEAQAEAEVKTVAVIAKAMPKQGQAAAWWLERRFPDKWGRRVSDTTLSTKDDKPLPIAIVKMETDEL